MKKQFFCIIPIIMLIMGCAGSAKPAENSAASSGVITLDQALKEAAVRIDERLAAKSKIAPLNFNSPHDKFSGYVLDELTANLVDSGKLTVVDRKEVDLIRGEFNFQFSGEVGDDSMQELGRMLGAQSIISGSLTDMGGFYRIVIRVLNVQSASVEVQHRANIVSDAITAALLTGGKSGGTAGTPQRASSGSGGGTVAVIPVQTAPEPVPASPPAPVTYEIGDKGPAGGIVFFDMGFDIDGWRYLEAAPQDIPGKFQWGAYGQSIGTQTALGSGEKNTEIIVLVLKNSGETARAAQVADAAKYGEYDDWFLPSKDELDLLYKNLKQKYLGNFQNTLYWSSSEGRANYALASNERNNGGFAWYQNFNNGAQSLGSNNENGKNESYSVRVIRRF